MLILKMYLPDGLCDCNAPRGKKSNVMGDPAQLSLGDGEVPTCDGIHFTRKK